MREVDTLRRLAVASALLVATVEGSLAFAAPNVQQVMGRLDHKASVTASGTGFGSKTTAAPLVWDDASGSIITQKWTGKWPDNNPTYNTDYRSPMRGIALPHNNISRYIAGSHAQSAGYNGGYNVVVWKDVPKPEYVYASWYQRVDDAWVTNSEANFKTFAYSVCCTPYEMPNNWYLEYNPTPTKAAAGTWHMNDDGASLQTPDANGHSWWWNSAVNPIGNWSKVEVAIKVSSQKDGYIKLWENGSLRMNYAGPTDKYSGSKRSIGIGGYARPYGQPNNWRYFADLYLDTTLARVVLANNADLARATIVEAQVPTAWSDNSVKFDVNLGKFGSGQTAYLFVVDGAGATSAGFPVVIGESLGGGGSTIPPKSPSGFVVQ